MGGNKGKKQKIKRERKVASNEVVGTKVAAAKVGESKWDKLRKLQSQPPPAVTPPKKKRGLERCPSKRTLIRNARLITSWCVVVFSIITMYLMLMIFASQTFGPEKTNEFLMSWMTAAALAWLVVEPLEVVILVCFPSLLNNKYVANVRQTLKDLGVI